MWRIKSLSSVELVFLVFLLPVIIFLVGCGREANRTRDVESQAQTKLSVAAAANLKSAFGEIEAAFERQYPNVDVVVAYGSSGNFFAQLSQEAPFDIFFSADTKYPQKLVEAGLASEESYFPYASGRIVVWVPNRSPLDLEALGIRAIIDRTVNKIAIANPRLAPYGAAAKQALQTLGVYGEAKNRLVLGDNIMQTAHFVESGAAEVGIIALSLALSPELKPRGRYWEISSDTHRPIDQAAVILIHAKNSEAANQLRAFVLNVEGRRILNKFRYAPPKE